MHRNIRSSVIVTPLRVPVATTIAIAVVALASLGQANSMEQAISLEEIPEQTVPDQDMPFDALGYLGGLFEARFYQPHSTTDDPRDEIQEAASLYGLDLAMMMSIAKVESDFDPRAEPDHTKGSFNLATTSSRSTVTAASGMQGTTLAQPRTCFWFKPRNSDGPSVIIQTTPRGTWSTSRVSKARLNTTHIRNASHGSPCVRPTKAC